MKQELNPVIAIIAIVVLIGAGIGTFLYMTAPRTPAGVKYTPGVPPWMDKNNPQTGKAGAPGGGYNPR
jgi:hypothetical protein